MPKPLREELGFVPGEELSIATRDGTLEVEASPTPMRLEERADGVVAVADREIPPLSVEQVRDTLERTRR